MTWRVSEKAISRGGAVKQRKTHFRQAFYVYYRIWIVNPLLHILRDEEILIVLKKT